MSSAQRKESERKLQESAREKRYQRPRIIYRESLEVIAAVCNDPNSKEIDGLGPCTALFLFS